MENKNTISVILPIKTGKAIGFEDFFTRAIQSVQFQQSPVDELVIVHCDEPYLTKHLSEYDFSGLTVVLVIFSLRIIRFSSLTISALNFSICARSSST